MKKYIKWSALALLLISPRLFAQRYFYNDKYYDDPIIIELGINIGLMNCLTDLGKPNSKNFFKNISWQDNHLCGGIYSAMLYKNCIGARLEANVGKLTAQDIIPRNLHFTTTITEVLLMGEFHFLYWKEPVVSPYMLAGIGLFKFNPQPHDIERRPYKLTQLNIPLGGGIKYEASALLNIRLEGECRMLMTDYLDDVSERGNPKKRDAYFSFTIKADLVINRKRR